MDRSIIIDQCLSISAHARPKAICSFEGATVLFDPFDEARGGAPGPCEKAVRNPEVHVCIVIISIFFVDTLKLSGSRATERTRMRRRRRRRRQPAADAYPQQTPHAACAGFMEHSYSSQFLSINTRISTVHATPCMYSMYDVCVYSIHAIQRYVRCATRQEVAILRRVPTSFFKMMSAHVLKYQ